MTEQAGEGDGQLWRAPLPVGQTYVKSPDASLCLTCSSFKNRVRVTMSVLMASWPTPVFPLAEAMSRSRAGVRRCGREADVGWEDGPERTEDEEKDQELIEGSHAAVIASLVEARFIFLPDRVLIQLLLMPAGRGCGASH